MRWPRLTRRSKREAAHNRALSGYTPGTWAQPAQYDATSLIMPPPEPAVTVIHGEPAAAAFPPQLPPPLVAQPPPPTQARSAAPPPFVQPPFQEAGPTSQPDPSPSLPLSMPIPDPPPTPQAPAVRLGFADGSDLPLDPMDPHTIALKAVADVLVAGEIEARNT